MVKKNETTSKKRYMCSTCTTEFTGKECPVCGEKKQVLELSPEGNIPKKIYNNTLGSIQDLSTVDSFDPSSIMTVERAKQQAEEMKDNIRESLLLKSHIKKKELEMEKLKKEIELNNLVANVPYVDKQPIEKKPQEQTPLISISPQQQVVSQLMRMDKKQREDFLAQLSEADPSALASLSALLSNQHTAIPPATASINPYTMLPMIPQKKETDSVEVASKMVEGVANMMKVMKPQQDNSIKEVISAIKESNSNQPNPIELATQMVQTMFGMLQTMQPQGNEQDNGLREELKAMNERIEKLYADRTKEEINAMREEFKRELHDIKRQQVAQPRVVTTTSGGNTTTTAIPITHSLNEIAQVIDGLEKLNLVKRAGEKESVDDKIKLAKLQHEIEMDKLNHNLKRMQVEAEKVQAESKEKLVGALFSKGLQKIRKRKEEGD